MGRKPIGERAMTPAERQARLRTRKVLRAEASRWAWELRAEASRWALEQISKAQTVDEAREIARVALARHLKDPLAAASSRRT